MWSRFEATEAVASPRATTQNPLDSVAIHLLLGGKENQMTFRYRVELSQPDCDGLSALLSGGRDAARMLKRAQISWLRTRVRATK